MTTLHTSEPLGPRPVNLNDVGVLKLMSARSVLDGIVTTARLAQACGWTTCRTFREIDRNDLWPHLGLAPEKSIETSH